MRYINSLLTLTLALTDRQADRYEKYLHWRGTMHFSTLPKYAFYHHCRSSFLLCSVPCVLPLSSWKNSTKASCHSAADARLVFTDHPPSNCRLAACLRSPAPLKASFRGRRRRLRLIAFMALTGRSAVRRDGVRQFCRQSFKRRFASRGEPGTVAFKC